MYRIALPGCRVYLRPVELTDAFKIVQWRNSKDSRMSFFDKHLVTPDTHVDFIDNRSKHDLVWMAFSTQNFEPASVLGMTSVTVHDTKNYIAEYGRTYVDEGCRGKGYAKEIEFLMLWAAFEWLKLDYLWLDAYTSNDKIIDLHYKTGWFEQGIDIKGHTDPGGQVTHMDYSRYNWRKIGRKKFAECFPKVRLPGWVE